MIRTPRLILRQWRDTDLPAYAALNADPEVRRWYPDTLNRVESNEEAAEFRQHIEEHGFGFWAVEVPSVAPFVGFVGLHHLVDGAFFAPAVEIGWRLAREHWKRGYATEAAAAALAHGFGPLGLREIVAYSVVDNAASRHVMDRIGMHHDAASDFDLLAGKGGTLLPAVLYRIQQTQWATTKTEPSETDPTSNQLRRACALLRWSPLMLVWNARISHESARVVLDGDEAVTVPQDHLQAIRRALEAAGVEFIPENGGGAGVRLKKSDLPTV